MPIALTKENHEQVVKQAKKPVIIDVFASWCGPCQQMEPIFEELEKELGDQYIFAQINVDDSRDLSIEYGVTSVPTFIFIKDGEVKGKATGYTAKDDFIKKIKEHLG